MAERSKERVCGRSLVGTAGSNPAKAWMSVSCERCVVRYRSLRLADPSPQESYQMRRVCVRSRNIKKWGVPSLRWAVGCCVRRRKILRFQSSHNQLLNCTEQRHSSYANSSLSSQKTACILWNPYVLYRLHSPVRTQKRQTSGKRYWSDKTRILYFCHSWFSNRGFFTNINPHLARESPFPNFKADSSYQTLFLSQLKHRLQALA